MAPRKKTASKANVASLAAIVEATQSEAGFIHLPVDSVKEFVDNGLVEVNTGMTDENGNPAVRATEKGIHEVNSENTTETTEAPAMDFEIETVPQEIVNKRRTGAGRPDKYPFAQLPAPVEGQPLPGFFVPATDAMPEPHKTLQATAWTASKRYARDVGTEEYQTKDGETKTRTKREYDRKFRVREGEKNGVKGAWVFRIA